MKNLTSANMMYLKGFLLLAGGILSAVVLIVENPTLKAVVLLAVAIWCFARFYYFAFYVIEHYIDSSYKFSGLWSFARYMYSKERK
jgi:hypothetical protein